MMNDNIEHALDQIVDSLPPTNNSGWERKQNTPDGRLQVYELRVPVEFHVSDRDEADAVKLLQSRDYEVYKKHSGRAVVKGITE